MPEYKQVNLADGRTEDEGTEDNWFSKGLMGAIFLAPAEGLVAFGPLVTYKQK
jgi:hypothetical protein